jgi:hypothetical protein
MAFAMAIFVGETSFAQLEKATEQTKAMLESWSVQSNENQNSYTNFNPSLPVSNNQGYGHQRNTVSKSDYEKYLWLFSGKRV